MSSPTHASNDSIALEGFVQHSKAPIDRPTQ